MKNRRVGFKDLKDEVGLLFGKREKEKYEFYFKRNNGNSLFCVNISSNMFTYRKSVDKFSVISENNCLDFNCIHIDYFKKNIDTVIEFTVDMNFSVLMYIKIDTPELSNLKYRITKYNIQCGNEYL